MVIINWFLEHPAIISGLVVAIIDFVWAVNSNLKSNGILHAIYDWLKKYKAPPVGPVA